MSHIDVTQGTIETLLINLDDALDNLVTLVGANAQYEVRRRDGTVMQAWAAIQTYIAKPRVAGCLVNTTVPSLWPSVRYHIYMRFVDNPDTPVVGPFEFSVNP